MEAQENQKKSLLRKCEPKTKIYIYIYTYSMKIGNTRKKLP